MFYSIYIYFYFITFLTKFSYKIGYKKLQHYSIFFLLEVNFDKFTIRLLFFLISSMFAKFLEN